MAHIGLFPQRAICSDVLRFQGGFLPTIRLDPLIPDFWFLDVRFFHPIESIICRLPWSASSSACVTITAV
jgi:hypothetical protein